MHVLVPRVAEIERCTEKQLLKVVNHTLGWRDRVEYNNISDTVQTDARLM